MSRFAVRSYQKEIMDNLDAEGYDLDQALRELRIINKRLGGNSVTTNGIQQLMQHDQKTYTVMDVGCGGGDMLEVIDKWAVKNGKSINLVGVDANPNIIQQAKKKFAANPRINFVTQNIFDPAFLEHPVDIITCTLFTHHFTDEELQKIFINFSAKARLGIVINDLHRHPVAYYSIVALTKYFSKSSMVKNDGPLSVLRGFSRKDWNRILRSAKIKNYRIRWRWAFRWQIICLPS